MDTIEIKFDVSIKPKLTYLQSGEIASYVVPDDESDDFEYDDRYSICILNGEKVNCTFDEVAFLRTGKTNPQEIFTCSCGVAGCAGIWDGIAVKVRSYTIEWRVPEGSNYRFLKKKFYSFDRVAYEATRKMVLETLLGYAEIDPLAYHWKNQAELIKFYKKAYEGKYWYE